MGSKKNDKSGSRSQLAAKFQHGSNKSSVLPPIGVFWDIENCQVPKGRSATALVQNIRGRLFKGHREAEFMCVCDISKESREVIHELNMAQVTVVHINAISKNAADDKLKQCMRRFVDIHGSPSTVVLISADVNFSTDLSDFRHRRKVTVILVHSDHAPEPLLACAHNHYRFEDLIAALPIRSPMKGLNQTCELVITDLPTQANPKQIQNRLKQLSDNCGGRVLSVMGSTAVLRFPTQESAQRARKRMDKEDVYGSKICVNFSYRDGSPRKSRSSGHSNPGSGSSREPSPNLSSADSSKNNLPTSSSDSSTSDHPVSGKKLAPSVSEPFHVTTDCKNVDGSTKNVELSAVSKSCDAMSSKNPPAMQQQSPFANKKPKTPQKNVGRVSPFMKMESATKQDVPTNRTLFVEPSSSSARSDSPSPSFSPSTLRPDYRLYSRNEFMTIEDARTSPSFFDVPCTPVELLVTNLDQNVEINEMKKILLAAFREHVMVLHVSMLLQPDGSVKSVVKVPSMQDAQFAISQLHRRKIGFKRILISYISNDRVVPLHILKVEVLALLADIPSRKLPLFKFRELFENRYHRTIGIPELYKLKEAIVISEDAMGRMVCLNPEYRNTPSPIDMESSKVYTELIEKSYCEQHFQMPEAHGWAELESVYPLPDVFISLKTLSPHVHTLLDSHQGCLPLNSFCACYEAEFGPLPIVPASREDGAGPSHQTHHPCSVPLEHLIACIPGIQIAHSSLGIKKIQWLQNKILQEQSSRCISPALVGQLHLFGKEIVDLIKSQPQCKIPFNKFVPTYHHHFGRQCRVADYGFIKLVDLLEAIPHIVQILGQGQNRTLMLTHRCQVKRFAADLLRVLKSIASKQLLLSEFPQLYEQCMDRPLDISHYGICNITDMLAEVSDNIVVTTSQNAETIIAIPKREQTSEEIELTKEFSREVLELLRHTPSCSMTFSKFIPSYHHHFGRQCRVSNYGFTKLIELFEAIPSVLELHGSGDNKIIKLTQDEKFKVLAERIRVVVRSVPKEEIRLDLIPDEYTRIHGHSLELQDFGSNSLHQMLAEMNKSFKLKQTVNGTIVSTVDCEKVEQISQNVFQLLMELEEGQTTLKLLSSFYREKFHTPLDLAVLKNIEDDVKIDGGLVRLSNRKLLARDILVLLHENGGQIALQNFENVFMERFGTPCRPAQFGCTTLVALLKSYPEYLLVRGHRGKKTVLLNFDTAGFLLPSVVNCIKMQKKPPSVRKEDSGSEPELMLNPSTLDLLSQPIPSNIPSPEIQPELQPFSEHDLMGFESPMPSQRELICDFNGQEQKLLRISPLRFTARTSQSAPSVLISGEPYCPLLSKSWLTPLAHYLDSSFLSASFSTDDSETLECPSNTSHESLAETGIRSQGSIRSRPRNRIAAHFFHSPN